VRSPTVAHSPTADAYSSRLNTRRCHSIRTKDHPCCRRQSSTRRPRWSMTSPREHRPGADHDVTRITPEQVVPQVIRDNGMRSFARPPCGIGGGPTLSRPNPRGTRCTYGRPHFNGAQSVIVRRGVRRLDRQQCEASVTCRRGAANRCYSSQHNTRSGQSHWTMAPPAPTIVRCSPMQLRVREPIVE
jgi:hypothetical protein